MKDRYFLKANEEARLDIYKIFSAFLICAFLGWIFETLAVWIESGTLTDRGYLFVLHPLSHYFPMLERVPIISQIPLILGLPIIEIYGFGGVLMLGMFYRKKKHPLEIFAYGFVLMTLFELLASYFCSYVLHHNYWDYSKDFMNFQGRICLRSSIAWGILSVFSIKVLAPFVNRIYLHEKQKRNFKLIVSLLILYAVGSAIVKYWIDPGIISS